MSFRHTFISEFIYRSGEMKMVNKVTKILGANRSCEFRGRDGLGYFYGILGSGYPEEPLVNNWLSQLESELSEVLTIPIRFTFNFESGPVIVWEFKPKK